MVEPAHHRKLTHADFLEFPEDGRRHELIDGEHIVSPAPFVGHQRVATRLTGILWAFLDRHPHLGEILVAPTDVVLSVHDVVEPDLLFVSAAHADQVTEANVKGPPDLVIEVLSPATRRRDLGRKLKLYERSGVVEYWTFDPEAGTATVYRRGAEGTLARVADLRLGDGRTLTTPLLPGLEIDLERVFGNPGGRRA